jgi:hypothetical protein
MRLRVWESARKFQRASRSSSSIFSLTIRSSEHFNRLSCGRAAAGSASEQFWLGLVARGLVERRHRERDAVTNERKNKRAERKNNKIMIDP